MRPSRLGANVRISRRLPITIALLLAVVLTVFGALTYRGMRALAEDQAADRLHRASSKIAQLLAPMIDSRASEVTKAVADPRLLRALVAPGTRSLAEARGVLDSLQGSIPQRDELGLWDARGNLVLLISAPDSVAVPDELTVLPTFANGDTASVGALRAAAGHVWFDVVAPVRDGTRLAGYLVKRRHLSASIRSERMIATISELIGRDARFLVGGPTAGWTDLLHGAQGPGAVAVRQRDMQVYQVAGAEPRVGTAEPIPGSGWYVWVEFPAARVYARPAIFLRQIVLIGLVLTLCGAIAGWLLSRPITQPLAFLTEAAKRMADGDPAPRLDLHREDELGELSLALDRMAADVRNAREDLEGQVARRTQQLEETLARLAGSEEQFRSLASSAGSAIVITDSRGLITFINGPGERMLGYGVSELLGRPISVIAPDDERADVEQRRVRMVARAESGSIGKPVEFTARRKDGTEIPVELSLASWSVAGERFLGGVMRDITQRRAMRASLEERARSLEDANRELAAFSYSVSHDLRAPLRGLQGFSEALLEDYGDKLDERGNGYLHRISDAAGRMGRLIDELLELSRVSRTELRREPVSLSALAVDHFRAMQQMEPGRQVLLLAHDLPPAYGDERLLSLVVQNLIENAWKFTRRVPEARVEFGLAEEERHGHPAYFVRDNGAGFDMQYADKLFGVFQRLHSETDFPGTGVGLAIVHRIILRHGGEIWAEGAPGRGATFLFTLGGRTIPAGTEA